MPKAKLVVAVEGEPECKLLRLKVRNEGKSGPQIDVGNQQAADVADELPEDVLRTLRTDTGGLVPDTLTLDYDYWLTCE